VLFRSPNSGLATPPGISALNLPLDEKAPPPNDETLRTALERFALEAFRGLPPPENYIDALIRLFKVRSAAGDKPVAALKETLSVVLSSPMFLYLAEPNAGETQRPLTDLELASRLSYFLWSAPPDTELRQLATTGELQKPEVLTLQTERMLSDPRSEGFTKAFTHQWLGLDRIDFFEINRALYPRFDTATKVAAKNEIYETLAHAMHDNASLRDLLKSDYVVINRVLSHYYDIPGVQGDGFEKVSLPADSPRGGLLGMAAIQFMGGNGERTSPVERGAWVLRKLLNDPPPPAPANVPAITRLAGKVLTTHERLLAHQEDPQCASCHRKIDPIGFGLENFDAAGQWRTEDSYQATDASGKPDPSKKKTWLIEASATFHKGPTFRDYFELRDIIAARSEAFARGYGSALIEYALGRSCGFTDGPLLDAMMRDAAKHDLKIRTFIHTLVASREFHMK
jgi:hypothetical protein